MRLFVAITPPERVRSEIRRATEPLRVAKLPVRWVPAGQLHLTLKFLGEAGEEQVATIQTGLDEAARGYRPFVLRLGSVGAFPSIRRARVVWLGVEAPEALFRLTGAIESRMERRGFEPDGRAFHPHITLGRVRKGVDLGQPGALERAAARVEARAEFEAGRLELVRSRLGPQGARHSVLSEHDFAGARGGGSKPGT